MWWKNSGVFSRGGRLRNFGIMANFFVGKDLKKCTIESDIFMSGSSHIQRVLIGVKYRNCW
jgi:hypothetical protein